jgi:hypothetical protein
MIITEKSNIPLESICPTHLTAPAHVWNLRVCTANASLPQGDAYIHGVRLHALLSRIKDHGPLSETERQYLPFLDSLRSELRLRGVSYLRPEQVLAHPQIGRGRCDVLLDGGLAPEGICEMKCVAELPVEVRRFDLAQLGRYAAMLGCHGGQSSVWGCVAYVCIRSRAIRIFAYSDLCLLGRSTLIALAA